MCDCDFIKIMSTNVHMEAAYGAKVKWTKTEGDRTLTFSKPLVSPKDVANLPEIDITTGPIAKEVEVARLLAKEYKGRVPVIATVDTPASYLKALYCGFEDPKRFTALVRDYTDDFKKGLATMEKVCIKMVDAFAKAGVDGIFIATNIASDMYMTEEEYKDICLESELAVCEATVGKTWFNILHVHGDGNVFFDQLVNKAPVQAVNWHITSNVSMKHAAETTDKILISGLDHAKDFAYAERDELMKVLNARVDAAIASVPKDRLIIGTGCSVIPPSVPDARIRKLVDIVEERYK